MIRQVDPKENSYLRRLESDRLQLAGLILILVALAVLSGYADYYYMKTIVKDAVDESQLNEPAR